MVWNKPNLNSRKNSGSTMGVVLHVVPVHTSILPFHEE